MDAYGYLQPNRVLTTVQEDEGYLVANMQEEEGYLVPDIKTFHNNDCESLDRESNKEVSEERDKPEQPCPEHLEAVS